ncbi:MAG: hypothetical protein V1722_02500 [Candidatus Micrarchaeota archaeon]
MGIITTNHKGIEYTHELITHSWPLERNKSELPVKKLNAVFLETGSADLEQLETRLNKGEFFKNHPLWHNVIERAEKHGAEIWLGDVKPNTSEKISYVLLNLGAPFIPYAAGSAVGRKIGRRKALTLMGAAIGLGLVSASQLSSLLISTRGNKNDAKVARKIVSVHSQIDPIAYPRDFIMAQKLKALAKITGHKRIGILTGNAHINITRLLPTELKSEAREKIVTRGPDALKMYRCVYNRQEKRWKVEEHSL